MAAELGAAAVAHEVFSYNRENYQFDREQQQKRELAAQNMRIKQFALYREDVRDLIGLTVNKMDNYMVINVLLLAFPIILFTEGRPKGKLNDAPWLLWLFELNNAGAFIYFLLSMWLALHASISAHAFGVRLLTQYIRLPIPNKKQLDAAQFRLQDYEAVSVETMFRVPVLQQMTRTINNMQMSTTEDAEEAGRFASPDDYDEQLSTPAAMLKHVQLFRQVQQNWQAYDGYARVCMTMGMLEMLLSLSFYTLNSYVAENNQNEPALACVLTMTYCGWLIWRLDIYTTRVNLMLSGLYFVLPPALGALAIILVKTKSKKVPASAVHFAEFVLVPLAFVSNTVWLCWTLWGGFAGGQVGVSVPTRFRAVLYLDVYGFFGREVKSENPLEDENAFRNEAQATANLQSVEEIEETAVVASDLKKTLSELSWKLCHSSDAALASWESESAQKHLNSEQSSGPQMLARIDRLRRKHKQIKLDLSLEFPDQNLQPHLDPPSTTWLEIEWVNEGQIWIYYFNVESGETIWTKPREQAATLDAVDRAIREFEEMKARFVGFASPWRVEQSFRVGNSADEQDLSRRVRVVGRDVTTSVSKAVEMLNDGSQECDSGMCVVFSERGGGYYCLYRADKSREARAKLPEMESPQNVPFTRQVSPAMTNQTAGEMPAALRQPLVPGAQETRYGGREAVDVSHNSNAGRAFGHSGDVGLTFGPSSAAKRNKRLPGQMPWRTFLYATSTLIGLWVLGTLVFTFEVYADLHFAWPEEEESGGEHSGGSGDEPEGGDENPDFRRVGVPDDHLAMNRQSKPWQSLSSQQGLSTRGKTIEIEMQARHAPRILYDGSWPHAFFTPRDLACHESLGQSIFIVEKYAVHRLYFNDTGVEVQPALQSCLMENPEFVSRGLSSISIECKSEKTCRALLLSASGLGGLWCSLTDNSSHPAYMRGVGWRSVATSHDGGAWALRAHHSVVRLGSHDGSELIPQYEALRSAQMARVEHLHVLQNRKLLGLDPAGWLHSWSLSGKANSRALLPQRLKTKWVGMCSIGSSLYLAGIDKLGKGATVWQMQPKNFVTTSVLV